MHRKAAHSALRNARAEHSSHRTPHRLRVSGLRALSAHDRGRKHCLRPSGAPRAARRTERKNKGHSRTARHRACAEKLSANAERGRTTTRGPGQSLVLKPRLLLLDEPFSSLDPSTKQRLYGETARIPQKFDCAVLFVTHDFREAQMLASRIGIMAEGRMLCIADQRISSPAAAIRTQHLSRSEDA